MKGLVEKSGGRIVAELCVGWIALVLGVWKLADSGWGPA